MTRAEAIARCRTLKSEGMTVSQIAERTGIARSTVGDYLLGDAHRRERDWRPCPTCGGAMHKNAEHCRVCVRAQWEEQRRLVERLWNEGKTAPEIARALGWKARNLGGLLHSMRAAGYHLPYRHRHGRAFPEQIEAGR